MKILAVQFENNPDIKTNVKKIQHILTHTSADVVILPESALTSYASSGDIPCLTLHDPLLQALHSFCQQTKKTLFLGANLKDGDQKYISYLGITPECIHRYDKTHLGRKEKEHFTAGDALKIMPTTINRQPVSFAPVLCIENHIPDIAQTLALRGTDILIAPFASPAVAGDREILWNRFLPARAYDNKVYVIALNLCGEQHQSSQRFNGGIAVYNFKGEQIYRHFHIPTFSEILFTIDLSSLHDARKKEKTNFLQKRRPLLYDK